MIELLAVVAIASILSVTAVQILMQSQLRGSQAEAVAQLRQDGDALQDQLTYSIRNSQGVVCQNGGSELVITDKQGNTALYQLQSGQLASNGAALTGSDLDVENLAFVCEQDSGTGASLVKFQFDLLSPGLSETIPDFRQSFSGSAYVRSFQ